MGLTQSKKKLLFKQVRSGNVDGIRALCQDGANLEWTDKEGHTPLILACMDVKLYDVAQALIELGANVNGYGRHSGVSCNYPLYHAAIGGLENTVELLLSNGANSNCHMELQKARYRYNYTKVVRTIERHICLFSGWMREFYGHALLDVVAPQFCSRSVWVVIVPISTTVGISELVVYASPEDAQPQAVMALRRHSVTEPKATHPNTYVTIIDNNNRQRSMKFAASIEEGRQQLKWFCDACNGIRQPVRPRVDV